MIEDVDVAYDLMDLMLIVYEIFPEKQSWRPAGPLPERRLEL
jgi:hypothetical protein